MCFAASCLMHHNDTAVRPEAPICMMRRTHAPSISPFVSALLSPFLPVFLLPIPMPAYLGRKPDLICFGSKVGSITHLPSFVSEKTGEYCCRLLPSHSRTQRQTEAPMGRKHHYLLIAAVLLLAAHAHASDLSAVIATRIKIEVR